MLSNFQIVVVKDSIALPLTSGHVSNTPCESCDFRSFGSRWSCCMYSEWCVFNIKSM